MRINNILQGNCLDLLKTFPDKSVDCCVTSPPYYMQRDYGVEGQIGMEAAPGDYINRLAAVFHEVYRVLKDTGTLWINIGDSYNGSKKNSGRTRPNRAKQHSNIGSIGVKPLILEGMKGKQLIGIPWRLAFALQSEWILRQDIIWAKTNCMPEPVKDRFCKSHEYIFLFSKQSKYYFNHNAALEPAVSYKSGNNDTGRWKRRGYKTKEDKTGLTAQHHGQSIHTKSMRIRRDVWFLSTESSRNKHYAMYPQKLIIPCILCGCPEGGIVLDPFIGAGTTAIAAKKLNRKYIGCEINPEYVEISEQRLNEINPLFDEAV